MDIIFNADAADNMIKQMDLYCRSVQGNAIQLLSVLKASGNWNDKQKVSFEMNMDELSKDLQNALRLESEYLRMYQQRVNELRG